MKINVKLSTRENGWALDWVKAEKAQPHLEKKIIKYSRNCKSKTRNSKGKSKHCRAKFLKMMKRLLNKIKMRVIHLVDVNLKRQKQAIDS